MLTVAIICAIIWFVGITLFILVPAIILTVNYVPFLKKEQLLMRYGYEWDDESDYWINKELDVSIPFEWFARWDYQHLYDYIEKRASH